MKSFKQSLLENKAHLVSVTVSNPHHTAVTQRKVTKERRASVIAPNKETAVDTALAFYKKQGYKVHDHNYVGLKEGAELNRGPQKPSKYTDPRVDLEMKATKKEYEHRAKHYAAAKAGDTAVADKEHKRMRKFQSLSSKINQARSKDSKNNYGAAIAQDYKDQEAKRGIGHVRDSVEMSDANSINELKSSTLKSYINKSVGDVIHRNNVAYNDIRAGRKPDLAAGQKVTSKRNAGQLAAQIRLAKRGQLHKEEVQHVSELKLATLLRYTSKATRSAEKLGGEGDKALEARDRTTMMKKFAKRDNRFKGIVQAHTRMKNRARNQ